MAANRQDAGKAGSADVNFLCQRCHQPLKLDQSFASIDQNVIDELRAPLTTSSDHEETVDVSSQNVEPTVKPIDPDVIRRTVTPSRQFSQDSGNGFTLIGETSAGDMENLSIRMKVTAHLFDVMSGQSEVDHPLCEECTDALLDQLDNQLKVTEDECRDYRDFLETLTDTEDGVDEATLEAELLELRAEEQTLQQRLDETEAERVLLQERLEKEKEISSKLDEEEEKYYKEYNEHKRQLHDFEEQQRSVDNQLKYAQSQLDKLRKTNVFNATFHIWHRGHFGTINNFRLGRLPSVPVDWNEINAAWGQTALLLHALAKKMNLTFQRYRLVPFGNHSYIESLSDKSKELPLYGSGGFRFFWDTKFDQAMVAFLDCLQQFKEEVEKGDTSFSLPYKMDKGKIEDPSTGTSYSIKIQFNSEEQWTKALKFMLTNLKWGLAWISAQFADVQA